MPRRSSAAGALRFAGGVAVQIIADSAAATSASLCEASEARERSPQR